MKHGPCIIPLFPKLGHLRAPLFLHDALLTSAALRSVPPPLVPRASHYSGALLPFLSRPHHMLVSSKLLLGSTFFPRHQVAFPFSLSSGKQNGRTPSSLASQISPLSRSCPALADAPLDSLAATSHRAQPHWRHRTNVPTALSQTAARQIPALAVGR
jgi:hypothetical protein